MTTQVKWNHTGETVEVIGTQKSKVNGQPLLRIKGWKSNQVLRLDMATTVDGNKLTPEMFESKSNPTNEIKEALMWVNGYSESKTDGLWSDLMADIQVLAEDLANDGKGNDFVAKICKSVRQSNSCSEKQAFIIAKYAVENGVKF